MKEKVVIEALGDDRVTVYPYYDGTISNPIEVCEKASAMHEYEIIGEMTEDGTIIYADAEDEEEDYSDFAMVDDEDDE